MEIVGISAALAILGLLSIAAWVYVRVEQYKIRFENPKRIEKLEEELKRQANIVNRLDEAGLEHVMKRSDEIAGKLKDIAVGNMLRR